MYVGDVTKDETNESLISKRSIVIQSRVSKINTSKQN